MSKAGDVVVVVPISAVCSILAVALILSSTTSYKVCSDMKYCVLTFFAVQLVSMELFYLLLGW